MGQIQVAALVAGETGGFVAAAAANVARCV